MGQITPSSDPGNFADERVRSVMGQVDQEADGLFGTADTLAKDPTLPPGLRDLKLREWVERKEKTLESLFQQATDRLSSQENLKKTEMSQPWREVPMSHAEEMELRTVFRELPADERRKVVLREILARNAHVMRAVQRDPGGFLTGLGPDFAEEARDRWGLQHFPEHVKALKSLALDYEKLGWAASSIKEAFEKAKKAGAAPAEAAKRTRDALSK